MSNELTEARALMEMSGPGSVYDPSFAASCISRWEPMLKGIPTRHDNGHMKRTTAILLENEMNHLKGINEDTLSTNTGSFTKYIFPLLRRVYPNLIANQIVSVQPMNSPTGGVFYYEKKYDGRKGSKIPQGSISNNPTDMSYDGQLAAGDNMNQNFAKYYSSEFVDYDAVCVDTGTSTSTLNQGSTNCRITEWSPIRDNGTLGQRTFYVKAYYRMNDADNASAATEVVATMNNSGNLVDNTANTNTVGTFNISTGAWTITPAGTAGTASNFTNNTMVYFQYFVNWELIGDTAGASIPSISLDITLSEIRAETKPLKASWSVQAAEDMKALHGVNAESELVQNFANEIMLETDRGIISDLLTGAAHSISYTYSSTVPGEIESIRSMLTSVGALSAQIHKSTGRAPANFMVVPPGIGSLLDQLSTHGDFASIEQNIESTSYGMITANYGIARIGTLLRKYAVYQDPYMPAAQILVGFKGNAFYDAGYVYAPYVPLQLTPTFVDPRDLRVHKGAWSRYATKMLRPEYYGVVNVSGLPSVTTTL